MLNMILYFLKWHMIQILFNGISVLSAFFPDRFHHAGRQDSGLILTIEAKVGLANVIS